MDSDNDSPHDQFLSLIDQSIESGDCKYIDIAIKNFGFIGNNYIIWANQIKEQLIIEKIEEISLGI